MFCLPAITLSEKLNFPSRRGLRIVATKGIFTCRKFPETPAGVAITALALGQQQSPPGFIPTWWCMPLDGPLGQMSFGVTDRARWCELVGWSSVASFPLFAHTSSLCRQMGRQAKRTEAHRDFQFMLKCPVVAFREMAFGAAGYQSDIAQAMRGPLRPLREDFRGKHSVVPVQTPHTHKLNPDRGSLESHNLPSEKHDSVFVLGATLEQASPQTLAVTPLG